MRRWLSFALLALVFLPATALGEDTYYYQGLDMARAKAHFEAALVRTIPDESLRAIPNLALPVDDDIWFLGAPQGEKCDPSVRSQVDEITGGEDAFELLLGMAQADLDEMNYGAARDELHLLARAIPCTKSVIGRATLARIFLYFGINAVYAGEAHEARSQFRQSVQLSGRPLWDANYPPLAREAYEDAAAEVEAYGRIDFAYRLPGLNLSALYVDGEEIFVDENVRGTIRVLPGSHIIQWQRLGEELETRVVTVLEWAQLVSTRGLQELLALRPEVGKGTPIARAQESILARSDETSVLVANPETGEPEFSYSYTGKENGEAGPVRYHAGEPVEHVLRAVSVRYKPVELRLGGGYVLGTSVTAALITDFWVHRSVAVEIGADAAFTGYIGLTDEDNRLFLMPSLRAGVRFEFRPERLIKPYAFALVRVSFSLDPPAMAGPVAGGGITFMFPSEHERARTFGFWMEASGGPVFSKDRPEGTLMGLIGFTLRPYALRE